MDDLAAQLLDAAEFATDQDTRQIEERVTGERIPVIRALVSQEPTEEEAINVGRMVVQTILSRTRASREPWLILLVRPGRDEEE